VYEWIDVLVWFIAEVGVALSGAMHGRCEGMPSIGGHFDEWVVMQS